MPPQAKQEELLSLAGELNTATEEASQLRKQLAALGAQLDAASSQVSQQQAAIAALEETKKQLQVRQGCGLLALSSCAVRSGTSCRHRSPKERTATGRRSIACTRLP